MRILLFLNLFLTVTIANAMSPAQFDQLLKDSHRGRSFHGNILIKQNGVTLYQTSRGQANREWNVPHQRSSKFMIASLTKQFTAYAVLNLASEQKLSLDDSISKYISLPKKSPIDSSKWEKITLRHLLSHSAGLKRDIKSSELMSTSDYNLLGTIVSNVLLAGKIINKDPGVYHYSNLGYLLLAQVIEKVSKTQLNYYFKRVIFTPLEMKDTGEFHRRKSIPQMASGYFFNESKKTVKRCCHDASIFTGSHHLYSTIDDLDKWNHELHGQTNILNRAVLDQMKEIQTFVDDKKSYAYGIFVDHSGTSKSFTHTGHEWGFSSLMTYIPKLKLSIIYLSNFHDENVFSFKPNHTRFQNKVVEMLGQTANVW